MNKKNRQQKVSGVGSYQRGLPLLFWPASYPNVKPGQDFDGYK